MPAPQTADEETCRRLRARVALSLAIEESFVSALSEAADQFRLDGDEDEARRLTALVHGHRVGIIERRAVLGAAGIEV